MKNSAFKKNKSYENGLSISSYGLPSRICNGKATRDAYKETIELKREWMLLCRFLLENSKFLLISLSLFGINLTSYCAVRSNYYLNFDEDGYHLSLPSGNRMDESFLLLFYPLIKFEDYFMFEHEDQCESC